MQNIARNYVTATEAAEIIGVTRSAVHAMIRRGSIQAERISERTWIIPRREANRVAREPQTVGRPRGS